MPTLIIQKDSPEAPTALILIAALNAELADRYPDEGANHFHLDAEQVGPGRGAFLVAWIDGAAVGCGAVRLLAQRDAEIKRMYVAPKFRGRGIARELLSALEAEARRLGGTRVALETGERQPEALALYERAGFMRIPPFGEYVDSPLSVCMAKDLSP